MPREPLSSSFRSKVTGAERVGRGAGDGEPGLHHAVELRSRKNFGLPSVHGDLSPGDAFGVGHAEQEFGLVQLGGRKLRRGYPAAG